MNLYDWVDLSCLWLGFLAGFLFAWIVFDAIKKHRRKIRVWKFIKKGDRT